MNAPPKSSAPPADEANSLDEPQATAKQSLVAPLVLIAIALLTFFFGLGRIALLGPDEPRYAEIAREMFATGDWISPRLCGCLWFEKPALVYWMSALGYQAFGISEFAARFGVAVAATLTVLLLYFVTRRVVAQRMAFTSGLVLATCGMFIGYARVASPDMPLAASMTVALLAGFAATQASRQKRTICWMISFAAMGLAVLAKGLPGVALVIGSFVIYFIWLRRADLIGWRELISGSIVFWLIAAIWYVPVTVRHGWEFIHEFFIRHHFQRYTSNEFGHPQPFYFFLLIGVLGIAPWSAFLMPAIARLKGLQPRAARRDAFVAFAWVWAAVVIGFFSFSGSKLPGYILPAFPALAIIVGDQIDRYLAGSRDWLTQAAAWTTQLLITLIAGGFAVYLHREGITAGGFHVINYILPAALALAAIAALIVGKRGAFIICTTGAMASLIACAVMALAPKISDELTLKPLSLEAAAALRPGERIAFFIRKEYAPVFYAQGRVVCGIGEADVLNALSEDTLADALKSASSFVVITTDTWRGGLERDERFTTEVLARQRDAVALRVSLKPQGK